MNTIDARIHNEQSYKEGSIAGAVAHVVFALLNSKENYFKIDEIIDQYGGMVGYPTFNATIAAVKKRFDIQNIHLKKRGSSIFLIKKSKDVKICLPEDDHGTIEEKIKAAGKKGIDATELYLQTRSIAKLDRKNIIDILLDNNVITVKNIPSNGTKPTKRYFII